MFHFMDIFIVAAIALALFGPKALQSMARSAGKGVGQAKDVKDKLMSEIPLEDFAGVADNMPQIPLNSRQAVKMLLSPDEKKKEAVGVDASSVKSEAKTEKAPTGVSESKEK